MIAYTVFLTFVKRITDQDESSLLYPSRTISKDLHNSGNQSWFRCFDYILKQLGIAFDDQKLDLTK